MRRRAYILAYEKGSPAGLPFFLAVGVFYCLRRVTFPMSWKSRQKSSSLFFAGGRNLDFVFTQNRRIFHYLPGCGAGGWNCAGNARKVLFSCGWRKFRAKNSGKKTVYAAQGELLFTHFGLSGPLILSASAHMRDFEKDRYHVLLDLKPALDRETLDRRLVRELGEQPNRELRHVMERLEPVVSAALTAGGFCLLAVLCLANAKTAQAIGWKRRIGIGNFLLGCTGYLAGTVLPEGVQAVAAAICWGIVPLLALWVASVKNLQKNQKNA